jgi:hypothetical protein
LIGVENAPDEPEEREETMISGKSCKVLLTTRMVKMALVPTSHKMKIISLLLAVLMYGPGVQAHTGDWQAVEKLTPGTRISVRAQHRIRCVFQRATDDELACKRLYRSLALSSEIVFDRQSVREVRLERSDEANGAVGALIGAGAGAAVGASNGKGTATREGGALLLGSIGAIAGWFIGADFHILHGKSIYKRSELAPLK